MRWQRGWAVARALPAAEDLGVLIASEEGQHLYAKLGWRPAADVLIATTA